MTKPDYKNAGRGGLRPLLFLADGKSAEVVLDAVRDEKTKDGGHIRYYDVTLVGDAEGVDREGNAVPFKREDEATVAGSAIINNRMMEAALDLMGEPSDSKKEIKWERFSGLQLFLTGQPSIKKKEGRWKGKEMRSLGIQYDASFKPK